MAVRGGGGRSSPCCRRSLISPLMRSRIAFQQAVVLLPARPPWIERSTDRTRRAERPPDEASNGSDGSAGKGGGLSVKSRRP
eukprot:8974099-Pyramimonas_sp.AAC.1